MKLAIKKNRIQHLEEKMESEIVISGMSGRFPESDNIAEFSYNLYNKVDLMTEFSKRWEPGLLGLPSFMGHITDITKFDAGFFGIHHKQAHMLDPQTRVLLELTYEAIVDAGYEPEELRGKAIGVFIGNSLSESYDMFSQDNKAINGYTVTGCAPAMLANRLSHTFDFKGPSYVMDTTCSSGALALYEAFQAMKNNECEAAIVGGSQLCLNPQSSLHLLKLGMLSLDGKCKSFSVDADGYGRSEAIVSLFLQRADVARRKYASLVHIRTITDGYKEQGVTFPSQQMQSCLIKKVYEESGVDPLRVTYVEAHGTGSKVRDPVEMASILDNFCQGRSEPLLVGAVKSNMGHSEACSGLCSVVKILIAMENTSLPPNLHFEDPNPDIPALLNGQIKIVTDSTPWHGEFAAFNCFGFSGVNVHAVLKSNPRTVMTQMNNGSTFPQLALYSGRTKESVQFLFDFLDKGQIPREFFALLHKSVYSSVQSKPFRGYKVNDSDVFCIKPVSCKKRSVWYIFSGMGTQWPAMAKDLMKLDCFANTICRLSDSVRPFGLDLIELITSGIMKNENNRSIIPAFVSIAAIQVALVDILLELGIEPDGIVGHSVGEFGCAYADGCHTGEQIVLAAYWAGREIENSNLTDGSMAALGITWDEAMEQCPKGVFPSCHDAEDSITVSGRKDGVAKFVDSLKAKNILAREVDSCGYAFHSQYIYPARKRLQKALEDVFPNPKPRTARWVSSSFPEHEWNKAYSKVADASYFVHNLVSPVLFYEALRYVPKDAIVIEIAPHHHLQTILKRVIGPKAEYVGMMKRHVNNSVHLLSSIGRLYMNGLNPDIEKLYPSVQFPVPQGTPMISPLIKWDHSASWTVAKWDNSNHHSKMVVEVDVGSDGSTDAYLLGHCIDGRVLYPATGYLLLVWQVLAEMKQRDVSAMPIIFENVKIHRATILSKTSITRFVVDITSVGGEFEISVNGMAVVTGHVHAPEETQNLKDFKYWENSKAGNKVNCGDVYKELRLRGYEYGLTFQGILESDLDGEQGLLKWNGNWVVFLDNMLQFSVFRSPKRALCLPTGIPTIKIDPELHKKVVEDIQCSKSGGIPIVYEKHTHRCIAGGVEIKNLKASIAPRQPIRQIPLLEEYKFVPYKEACILSNSKKEAVEKYIDVCSTMSKKILECAGRNKDQITDYMNGFREVDERTLSGYLKCLSTEHVLLNKLQGILLTLENKELNKIAKLALTKYLEEKELDLLDNTMTTEVPLKTVLDIVLENSSSRQLNILEVHNGVFPLSTKIHNLLESFSVHKLHYTVAHPKPEIIDQESLVSGGIRTIPWSLSSNILPDVKAIDLLVVKNLSCSRKELMSCFEKLMALPKSDGFILVLQRTKPIPAEMFLSALSNVNIAVHSESDLEQVFDRLKLITICKKSDGLVSSLYLLRKVNQPVSVIKDSVVQVKTSEYETWVEQLKIEFAKVQYGKVSRIWLVSENDSDSGVIGLLNCLRQEPDGASIRCIYFNTSCEGDIPKFHLSEPFYKEVLDKGLTMNVYSKGEWGSFRHTSIQNDETTVLSENAYLNVMTRGDLSSFRWFEYPLKHFSSAHSPNTVLCHVYYAPLNFRDVMLASGKLPVNSLSGDLALEDCVLGLEFSGRDTQGRRIMGSVASKGLATTVAANADFIWDVPDDWTLEEASTVPVAYSTAYFSLLIRGNLKKGEKVLIHSGSGGVGQAAISIALSMGCEVFTTVGSSKKGVFLKKRFPQLREKNIFNSRDISFEQNILRATEGEGVDVVLNSLSEEKLRASLNCVAQHGRFLEIGKYDFSNNSSLGMDIFLKGITFHGIVLDALFDDKSCSITAKKEIVRLLKDGISSGTVKPLNSIIFEKDKAEQAFRYMASGQHIGKVVLKIREEEAERCALPTAISLPAIPRTMCNPGKTYIIIGGLGGFGLELCQWLIDRGAQNIILTSRSGLSSGYQHLCMNRWKKTRTSVNVIVSKLNVADMVETKELFQLAYKQGPVGGIFNLALVLRDAFMENQTIENFRAVCESKVQSTQNLDILSRDMCPDLEWFVCFSSVSCGRGNAGQSNYGFANSVMERICERRRSLGLHGLTIQWGAIGDVGVFHDTVSSEVIIGGTIPQRISSCLSVLDKFLQQNHPVVSSVVPYKLVKDMTKQSTKCNALLTVANVFGIKDINKINFESTLGELGMDSLMGVEIQQFLERDYELSLSIQEIRQMKVKQLKNLQSNNDDTKILTTEEQEMELSKNEKALKLESATEMRSLPIPHLVPLEALIPLNSNRNGIPLFIVHPIEGSVHMLETLAKLIDCPVYGLQCTTDAPLSSVEKLALWYWKVISDSNFRGPIHLAGYSFGPLLAFEMAFQAECDPSVFPVIKSLIMLDGSPGMAVSYVQMHALHFVEQPEVEDEVESLCAFISLFFYIDIDIRKLRKVLFKLSSFEERVNLVAEKIVSLCQGVSKEKISQAFDLCCKRFLIANKYMPKNKLNHDIVLLKASESVIVAQLLSQQYDIEKVCNGVVRVYTIAGTHNNFIQGENATEASKVLNTLLNEYIREIV